MPPNHTERLTGDKLKIQRLQEYLLTARLAYRPQATVTAMERFEHMPGFQDKVMELLKGFRKRYEEETKRQIEAED